MIGSQHGGNYGNLKATFMAPNEYYHDAFLTWGWTSQNEYNANFIDLPSPYLSKIKRKRNSIKTISNEIVMVGTYMNIFSYRLDTTPQPLQQLSYRKDKLNFLKELNIEILSLLKYRPYMYSKGAISDLAYFDAKVPGLKIITSNFENEMLRANVLILDHPITSFLVAIAANIPFICFWDENAWGLSRQSQPYFNSFKKAGVLFNNGIDAARQLNKQYSNIDEWWNGDEIQKARRLFEDNYARNSKKWRKEWIKMLKKI